MNLILRPQARATKQIATCVLCVQMRPATAFSAPGTPYGRVWACDECLVENNAPDAPEERLSELNGAASMI